MTHFSLQPIFKGRCIFLIFMLLPYFKFYVENFYGRLLKVFFPFICLSKARCTSIGPLSCQPELSYAIGHFNHWNFAEGHHSLEIWRNFVWLDWNWLKIDFFLLTEWNFQICMFLHLISTILLLIVAVQFLWLSLTDLLQVALDIRGYYCSVFTLEDSARG